MAVAYVRGPRSLSTPLLANTRVTSSPPMLLTVLARRCLPQACRAASPRGANTLSTRAGADGAPGWTLTLERGIGKAYGNEAELQATGAFRAEVFPDLPIATTWQNLGKALTGRLGASATADPSPPFTHYTTHPDALKVITAAANLRTEHELEMRLLQAAGEGAEAAGGQRADVLLCVSGSHPVRTLPLVSRFFRSSLDILRVAQRLKQQGAIPASTQLWVVANPNTERSAALLEAKAELGASAVLTQPPLDWPAYLSWLDDAERRGLLRAMPPAPASRSQHQGASSTGVLEAGNPRLQPAAAGKAGLGSSQPYDEISITAPSGTANGSAGDLEGESKTTEAEVGSAAAGSDGRLRLLVGHPVISSAANLSFWAALSGCAGSVVAQRLVADAARAEMEGAAAAAQHALSYNRQLVQQILERGGVGGLHVMPITKAAKKIALQMLEEGTLPRSFS